MCTNGRIDGRMGRGKDKGTYIWIQTIIRLSGGQTER